MVMNALARWLPALPRAALVAFSVAAFGLLVLPIPIHTEAAADLKELRPALAVLDPGAKGAPLVGFRTRSLNLRASAIFYLDRDLRNVELVRQLDVPVVLALPERARKLRAIGFQAAFANRSYVLLRPPPGHRLALGSDG